MVVKDVKKGLNSCEEFMELIITVEDVQGLPTWVILSSEDHLTTLTSAVNIRNCADSFEKLCIVMELNHPPLSWIEYTNILTRAASFRI